MKKLVAFVVIGGALVAALPSPASAQAALVALQCTTFFGSPPAQQVFGVQASTGFTPPASCAAGAFCTQCVQDILSTAPDVGGCTFFFPSPPFTVDQAITGYAGPYFVLQRVC